jgi:hypothetical protein
MLFAGAAQISQLPGNRPERIPPAVHGADGRPGEGAEHYGVSTGRVASSGWLGISLAPYLPA